MFKIIFEKHAVLKKYLRANHSKTVTKELLIWKSKEESRGKCKKQKSVYEYLLKKAKKDY